MKDALRVQNKKDFFLSVKHFITNKGCSNQKDVMLQENNNIITNEEEICELFNNVVVNVARNIGDQSIKIDKTHPRINAISEKYSNATKSHQLIFKPIDESFVSKRISNINAKKATGVDNISPKLLHYAKPVITKPISDLVSLSLSSATFSDSFNIVRVAPIHKKNSVLEKGNNRPVSLLSVISKIFDETAFLAAFRSGYGCQWTLLRIAKSPAQ